MNCLICGHELEREESWDGGYKFVCPLCNQERCNSKKAPKEESILKGGGKSAQAEYGYRHMDWNKIDEE